LILAGSGPAGATPEDDRSGQWPARTSELVVTDQMGALARSRPADVGRFRNDQRSTFNRDDVEDFTRTAHEFTRMQERHTILSPVDLTFLNSHGRTSGRYPLQLQVSGLQAPMDESTWQRDAGSLPSVSFTPHQHVSARRPKVAAAGALNARWFLRDKAHWTPRRHRDPRSEG
jgi:hypothetical protein